MMVDEDYMDFMSDTLFTTIAANQPFAFPDPREIGKFSFCFLSNMLPILKKTERLKQRKS